MSLVKKSNSPDWYYDFVIRGERFQGSAGTADRRKAESVERDRKAKARAELSKAEARKNAPMTFGQAANKYDEQVGRHTKTASELARYLVWLEDAISPDKPLAEIGDALVAELVAKRRGEPSLTTGRPVSAATVNRTVVEPLRRIVTRAAKVWKQPVPYIDWGQHLLEEPQEIVRELKPDEEGRLLGTIEGGYHDVVRFALMTGARLAECAGLTWDRVDFATNTIWLLGKGDKLAPIPMPPTVRAVLELLRRRHPERVFTYVARRTDPRQKVIRGQIYPITYEGLKTEWRRRRAKAQVTGFRFHDLRHTAATRLVRKTGNIKHAQKLLRHADIGTTMKYAHVTHDDLMEAMERTVRRPDPPPPADDE